jgi:uncharacterized membrane protein
MSSGAHVAASMNAAEMRLAAQRRDTKLMVWAIVALGALLRVRALSAKSFWLDEIASVVIARMPGNFFWHWLGTQEGNMALYYVMLRPWLGIHLGEGTVRLLSVLPGVASLPVMYLLGKRLFGRSVGLLASLFLALSTCAVVYSQEARAYSWLLFGVIVSTYFFVRLIEQPTYAMACAYGLTAGVTFYFHYFGLLVPLAHAVSLLALPRERRPWKHLILAAAMIGTLGAPVLWMIHIQPVRHLDWVSKPSLLELYHLGVFLAAESGKGAGPALLVVELILLVVFFHAMVAKRRSAEPNRDFFPYVVVASGLLTPIVFSLLVSIVRPVFFHRFLIICLPAWLLAIAAAICALAQRRIALLAVAGVCVLSVVSTALSYSRVREDWRGAVNFLIDNARSQDVVLYYQSVGGWAAENYRDWLPGGGANRPTAVSVDPQGSDWRNKIAGARKVWLVEYPANATDDTTRAVETELHSRYAATATQQYRAITV